MLFIASRVYLSDKLFSLVAGRRLITLAWFSGRAMEMLPCRWKESMLMGAEVFFVSLLLSFALSSRASICLYSENRFASEGVANLVLIKDN